MVKFNADNIVVHDTLKTSNIHINDGYVKGNLIPDGTTQSIGTPTRPWKELYVSENTIKFINTSTLEELNSIGVDETGNIKFGGNGLNLSSITADTTLNMKNHSITMGTNVLSSTENGMLNVKNGLQLDAQGSVFIDNNKFKFNMGIIAPSDLKIEDDEDGTPATFGIGSTTITSTADGKTKFSAPIQFSNGKTSDDTSRVDDGEKFGEFTSIQATNTSKHNDYLIEIVGSYNYGEGYDTANGKGYKIYDFGNYGVYPVKEDNTIDLSKGKVIATGKNPNNIKISMFYEDVDTEELEEAGALLVLVPDNYKDANDLFNIRIFDLQSPSLQAKFLADFQYVNNEYLLNQSLLQKGLVAHHGYVNLSSSELFSRGSTSMLVDYIAYYNVPSFDINNAVEGKFKYFTPMVDSVTESAVNRRLTKKIYVVNENDLTVTLENNNENDNDNGLYPRISYATWKNSVEPLIKRQIYNDKIGWGSKADVIASSTTMNEIVKNTIIAKYGYGNGGNGWLRELLKLTFKYVKYGNALSSINIDSILNTITNDTIKENIEFVVKDVVTKDNTILKNATAIIFKETFISSII